MKSGVGLVVVPRGCVGPKGHEKPERLVFVAESAPGDVANYSSTRIRKALEDDDFEYVRQAISEPAARLLLRPEPGEYDTFRADFDKLGIRLQTVIESNAADA